MSAVASRIAELTPSERARLVLRRTARIRNVVRIILGLEHVEHVRSEGLVRLDNEGAGGIADAIHNEWRCRAQDRDAIEQQGVDELRGRQKIRLIRGQDVPARIARLRLARCVMRRHRPRIAAAPFDGVLPHPVHVEQERLAVA